MIGFMIYLKEKYSEQILRCLMWFCWFLLAVGSCSFIYYCLFKWSEVDEDVTTRYILLFSYILIALTICFLCFFCLIQSFNWLRIEYNEYKKTNLKTPLLT
jgi:hypothetical protein